ncbi:MAG: sulfate/thiosulfate transport system substrate-binding protein [Thermoleophilaceae bacterium]|jgi:sulfate transport system substrate-binding protein|nr:sulfate/thiosulfate transport system substrate-binding protein [Thermoleophilaceae bacterium]
MSTRTNRIVAAVTVMAAALGVTACGGGASTGTEAASGGGSEVSLVAYSTPQAAMEEAIPAFQATDEGAGVTFKQSYGASGDQSRAVEAGLPADLGYFSLEGDVTRLVDAGMVAKDWNQDEYNGILTDSVVVLMVRPGNPENIQTWDDLIKPGVEVIVPNPIASGGARWDFMAAYGYASGGGKDEAAGTQFLSDLLDNVSVQDTSARESLGTFTSGKGDVLIGYENEAIAAQDAGEDLEYVVPDSTLLIENPAAVVNTGTAPDQAQAYLDFLHTDDGQEILQSHGYRPVDKKLVDTKKFPTPSGLFTIGDLGGWSENSDKFFGESGIVTGLEEKLGVPTS